MYIMYPSDFQDSVETWVVESVLEVMQLCSDIHGYGNPQNGWKKHEKSWKPYETIRIYWEGPGYGSSGPSGQIAKDKNHHKLDDIIDDITYGLYLRHSFITFLGCYIYIYIYVIYLVYAPFMPLPAVAILYIIEKLLLQLYIYIFIEHLLLLY